MLFLLSRRLYLKTVHIVSDVIQYIIYNFQEWSCSLQEGRPFIGPNLIQQALVKTDEPRHVITQRARRISIWSTFCLDQVCEIFQFSTVLIWLLHTVSLQHWKRFKPFHSMQRPLAVLNTNYSNHEHVFR